MSGYRRGPARADGWILANADCARALTNGSVEIMFERFDATAVHILTVARDRCLSAGRIGIEVEDILLALLADDGGRIVHALQRLGLDRTRAIREAERTLASIPRTPSLASVPFTPRVAEAIRTAARETDQKVLPENLLVALALDEEGVLSQLLLSSGIDIDKLRQALRPTD